MKRKKVEVPDWFPIITAWDKLSWKEQNAVIKDAADKGIYQIKEVKKYYNTLAEGGEITYSKPYYSYDESGRKVDNTLNYNATLPEIIITPDNNLDPAERNYRERLRQKNLKDYAEKKDRERTEFTQFLAQRQWENSSQKKALDLGIAAAQGVGTASDITSSLFGGVPVYSGLKGAQALDRAIETSEASDYVDAGLWLSPMLTVASKKAYNAAKPAIENTFKRNAPAIEWAQSGSTIDKADNDRFIFNGFKEDPLQMHLKRAEVKGYDTSGIKIINVLDDSPEANAFIEETAQKYNMTPESVRAFYKAHLGAHGHAGNPKDTRIIIHDGTNDNLNARISHEVDHLLHTPEEPLPENIYYPRIFKTYGDYFKDRNNTEIAARGSQLHDYFGHTGNEPITEDMIEYAKHHYIQDTGLDNDMHDFLWTVKDNKGLADWLTKYSTGIAPFAWFTTSSKNKE